MSKLTSVSLFVIALLVMNNLGWVSIPRLLLIIPAYFLGGIWALIILITMIIVIVEDYMKKR